MRRDAFMALTGLSADNLKNLTRRSALPIATVHEDDGTSGWRDFSARDVLLTLITLSVASAGIAQAEASSLTLMNHELLRHWNQLRSEGDTADVWFGFAKMTWDGGEMNVTAWFPVVGAPTNLILRNRSRQHMPFNDSAAACSALNIVNVSRLQREISARAKAAGMFDDFDNLF